MEFLCEPLGHRTSGMMSPVAAPSPDEIESLFERHVPLYRFRRPHYQTVMVRQLADVWDAGHKSVLDVGGGTGIIAQALSDFFPVEQVVSIDVESRFAPSLSIVTKIYDGDALPFETGSFDCVLLTNVIHHVDVDKRVALLRECRRVAGSGPIYIKDHVAASSLDHTRLRILDWLGNKPFRGMTEANYLESHDWSVLRRETGHREEYNGTAAYRSAALAALFPNRLEILMKWVPA